jgi:hypothetical protein
VGSLWEDRLVEVWAAPNKAGAGVLFGGEGVLTAWHVVKEAASGSGRVLARVVRRDVPGAEWVAMQVSAVALEWDVALLVVDDTNETRSGWVAPTSAAPTLVRLAASAEPMGFPPYRGDIA